MPQTRNLEANKQHVVVSTEWSFVGRSPRPLRRSIHFLTYMIREQFESQLPNSKTIRTVDTTEACQSHICNSAAYIELLSSLMYCDKLSDPVTSFSPNSHISFVHCYSVISSSTHVELTHTSLSKQVTLHIQTPGSYYQTSSADLRHC